MDETQILTVTLNPAVDETLVLPCIVPGDVHRIHETHLDPAGKGINAARVAHRLGCSVLAMGLLGGDIGHLVEHALAAEGVPAAFTPNCGQTRINVNIFERGTQRGTSFYADGPPVAPHALAEFRATFRVRLEHAKAVILAGSLPPGLPDDTYAELIGDARSAGVPALLDCAGESLLFGLEAGAALIKPNRDEAGQILGRALMDRDSVVAGAQELYRRGGATVVISLAGAGAIAVDASGIWHATPPRIELRSTVGSGDSMLAGIAAGLVRGESLESAVRLGTAAGAATAMTTGTALARAEDVAVLLPQVRVCRL